MKKYQQYMKWIIAFVFGAALIAVYKTFDNLQNVMSFIGEIFSALTPFIIGAVIAYILNLPTKKLDNFYSRSKLGFIRDKSKALSIVSVYVIFVLLIAVLIKAVIPNLYSNVIDLYNNIIPFTQNALGELDAFQQKIGITFIEINSDTAKAAIQNILNSLNIGEFGRYAKGAISFTSGLLNVFIALIISVYMLIDKERLISGFDRVVALIVPDDKESKVRKYLTRINNIFSSYIYCCVLDAVVVAVLATIILSLLGVKYSIIFGTFIGLCNLIPYFGAIISNCITVLITIFSGGIMKAVWVAVSLFILGQIDGNFIGPKIMGNKLDVQPLWIIFAVTLGGGLFGVPGMLLSVPAMMVLRMIVSEVIDNLERKKQERTDE